MEWFNDRRDRKALAPVPSEVTETALHVPDDKTIDPFMNDWPEAASMPPPDDDPDKDRPILEPGVDDDQIEALWAHSTTADELKEGFDELDGLQRLAAAGWPAGYELPDPTPEELAAAEAAGLVAVDDPVAEAEAYAALAAAGWPPGADLTAADIPEAEPSGRAEKRATRQALRRLKKSGWPKG
jgi:hypothetical protein